MSPPCLCFLRWRGERERLGALGPGLRTAWPRKPAFAAWSPGARGLRVRGAPPGVRTAWPRKPAFAPWWVPGSIALGWFDRFRLVLARFPDASEPVAEADRGGAVALRLRARASVSSVARLTKPTRSTFAPAAHGAGLVRCASPLLYQEERDPPGASRGEPGSSNRRSFALNCHGCR